MPCFQRAPIEERNVDPWSLPSRRSKRGFDPANRESFLSLCNLIAPEDPALKERVCHSIDDADQFAKFNRKYLGRDTYWLPFDVIVNWMEDHDMLIRLDHNCEFEEIAWAVNKLMHTQVKEFQFVVQADSGSELIDQLTVVNHAGKKVREMGHVLASLNTGDSFELFVFPKEKFDKFRTTMNSLNYVQIEIFE